MLKMRPPKSICTAKVSGQRVSTLLALAMAGTALHAQQAPPIGHTHAKEVQVSGAVEVRDGEMQLGNGSAITAGTETVNITLSRGGQLRLCATTAVHLSHDTTVAAPDSSALMMALDKGAIETDYETGKYSDVLLTPDLRILISPPGHADLSVRVNARGDTCVDNHGANAPYITVSSQFDGGIYRLKPNQHVTFEHGGLRDVVDTENEPCGCPVTPPVAVASAGKPIGGPSSTPADTTFPLAQSEGLAPAPPLPTTPVVPQGQVHAEVSVPLSYNGELPPVATAPAPAASSAVAANQPANKPTPARAGTATPADPGSSATVIAGSRSNPSTQSSTTNAHQRRQRMIPLESSIASGTFFSRVFGRRLDRLLCRQLVVTVGRNRVGTLHHHNRLRQSRCIVGHNRIRNVAQDQCRRQRALGFNLLGVAAEQVAIDHQAVHTGSVDRCT